MFFYVLYSLRLLLRYSNTMLIQNKSDMWPGNMTWIEACSTALPTLVIFLPCTLIRDKFIVRQASQGCCCNARLVKSAATGSAGWQVIKLQSSHWYQQTSLSILMGLWLHCVQCTCSCKQTHVRVHVQIIRLTRNVLRSCMQIDGIIQ